MPYSATTISSGEATALTADKPLFVGNSVLEDYNAIPQWRVSGSWASGTDISDNATYPVWRGFDRAADSFTQPTSVSGQATVYYICDLANGTDDLHTVDSVFIIGHNFGTLGATALVQIADDNAFSTNLITLATWT